MICSLPTYLQTHLSGPDRRTLRKGNDTMKFPVAQWAHFPVPIPSVNPFSLQRAATKHGVYPDQVNPRSGACTIHARTTSCSPSPSPPRENTHNATNPGRRSGSWFVMFRHSTCLPVLPACTACSDDHGRI